MMSANAYAKAFSDGIKPPLLIPLVQWAEQNFRLSMLKHANGSRKNGVLSTR